MEESVKRRERLKAMRTEASQTDGSNTVEASTIPGFLSNPLVETSSSLPAHDLSVTPRFDYYTDPLSAFSGSKKRSKPETQDHSTPSNVDSSTTQLSPSHQGTWNPTMPPPPHQLHSNYVHGQKMYPPQAPPYNSSLQGFPTGTQNHDMPPPPPPPRHHNNYTHGQKMYPPHAPPYNSGPQGFPTGNPFFAPPPNPPFPNPEFRQMGRPQFGPGQVRGNWFSQSPRPNSEHGAYSSHGSGRGRGRQFSGRGMNPGGGRGQGQGNHARGGPPTPERLYLKSMVEDPWKFCQPVEWKSCSRTAESSQSWLPKSISSNTTRVVEAPNKSWSGPSLAASLAASLYETVNENDKQGM